MGGRWLMVAAGMWIQCTAGSSYTFGLYSEALKRSLGYNQKQLDAIGFVKDLGANVGVHAGLLYNIVPPWITIAIGAAHDFLGYFMLWLGCTGLRLSFWHASLFMFLAANAQVYLNTAVIVTSVKSFPESRGTVIGLTKGLLGLSGAILSFLFPVKTPSEQISFILFISLFPTITAASLMFLVRPYPNEADHSRADEKRSFYEFSGIAFALAICLMCYNLIRTLAGMGNTLTLVFRILVLVIAVSPLAVVLRSRGGDSPEETSKLVVYTTGVEDRAGSSEVQETSKLDDRTESSEVQETSKLVYGTGIDDRAESSEVHREDHTLGQAFSSLDFWLLFVAAACGMGSGLTAIDNLSQIGLSQGYSHSDISTLVSLLSISNFLGRFLSGLVSDAFLSSSGTPRPVFTVISLGVMALGNLAIASALPGALYVGIVVVGFCYGSHWSLLPATISEVFGLTHFGTLFNTVSIASPLGSYILSVRIAGWIYDREAEEQGATHGGATSCTGPQCFRLTFLIVSAVCLGGCLSTLLLVLRTRSYYSRLGKRNG